MTPSPHTYRCRGVVWTGVAWISVGVVLLALGAILYRQTHTIVGPGLVCVVLGVFVVVVGIGFVTSRITLTDTQLRSRWFFATTHVDWSEAIDVALAPPKSMIENQDGWPSTAAAYQYADFVFVGFLLRQLAILMSWVGFPGSGSDQVLHVITRHRGAVRISPISCRLENHPGDVVVALSAVQARVHKPEPRARVEW